MDGDEADDGNNKNNDSDITVEEKTTYENTRQTFSSAHHLPEGPHLVYWQAQCSFKDYRTTPAIVNTHTRQSYINSTASA